MTAPLDELSDFLHIGFDDTDSVTSGCTTHLAFKIVRYLLNIQTRFIDYPLLIRLNPNVPWKTRGNGAVCLRIRTTKNRKVVEYIKQAIEVTSETARGTNPAVAFLKGERVPDSIKDLSRKALFDIVPKQYAEKLAHENSLEYYSYGSGQGLVGSLAAIGSLLSHDHTYEAIAYRKSKNCGTVRAIDPSRVRLFSKNTFPNTFNNYDERHRRVLITPHGPDPVFCGIRGENPEVVVRSLKELRIQEELDGYMVFRSNQGTNMHLQAELNLKQLKTFSAGYLQCKVSKAPCPIPGGHVIFHVQDENGSDSPAAVYEPTGLTNLALGLNVGDTIEIGCSVRGSTLKFPKILNVEYILVLRLNEIHMSFNPICHTCGKRMKSEGRNKGFQCDKCGFKDRCGNKIHVIQKRTISRGLYIPTANAHRHLTKPLQRYGMEKTFFSPYPQLKLYSEWFCSLHHSLDFSK
ncbi:MAG TPA: tRNA(Ile)(2)-agmatinylcytidine synthase [Nitrososphaeraceae archaeon]|nr:tRNA(Ile)(2)-agmatinylcytidine synthase [Nitrososphaeraceae archaeon]